MSFLRKSDVSTKMARVSDLYFIFENSRKRLAVYTPCAECVLVEIK